MSDSNSIPVKPSLNTTTVGAFHGLVVTCASRTLDALEARGHLKSHEREHIEQLHGESLAEGNPSEVFETITRLSTVMPREIPDFIAGLGLAVAKTLKVRVPVVPGLTRLATPNGFYDVYPELASLARALLVPVLYSEDNETIGLGSVNPIPALELRGRIIEDISNQSTFTPFVSVVRLDYDTWRTLIERHFGL